ncbi:MAG: tryptophan 7-halogenase, partial [Armatimonadetes bacterium]|nr:tryptophan 7-halogenase [Armatimonadota bacterium]
SDKFVEEPRPASYRGQRERTAFQVDRARYDEILLSHAQSIGCDVEQGVGVAKVRIRGDRVESLVLSNGKEVVADHYIDASGNVAVLRKAMGVKISEPAALRNIAIWDYWENAEWAKSIGIGGTMVQVMSIANGWIWFIPLSPTRTSIGFICPADYYKNSGKSTEQLYLEALPKDENILTLIENAQREGKLQATKDWSFLSERMTGENWLLVGETAGFADPILAAGLTLTHCSAREAAYIVVDMYRGSHDSAWLKKHYEETQKQRILQHIRFADFWYAANGQFEDLFDHTAKIAKEAGITLTPEKAFQWLGTGGFADDIQGQAGLGGFDMNGIKQITNLFLDGDLDWMLNRYNTFKLDIQGATEEAIPVFKDGKITSHRCFFRDGRKLPIVGFFGLIYEVLRKHSDIVSILQELVIQLRKHQIKADIGLAVRYAIQPLEVMVTEGWVNG